MFFSWQRQRNTSNAHLLRFHLVFLNFVCRGLSCFHDHNHRLSTGETMLAFPHHHLFVRFSLSALRFACRPLASLSSLPPPPIRLVGCWCMFLPPLRYLYPLEVSEPQEAVYAHWDSDIGEAGDVAMGLWVEVVATSELFFLGVFDYVS